MLAYEGCDLYIEKMQESLPNTFPFPRAIGCEEETGLIVGLDGVYDEPYDLCVNRTAYLPDWLKSHGQSDFLTNGSKLYIGGTDEDLKYETNLERATPETISPWQLTEYSRGSELLIEDMLKRYSEIQADHYTHDVDIRMHRRVVDAAGNRKACHDNYGLEKQFADKYDVPQSLIYLLAARSLIVGAGLVTEDGYQYAQKIDGLKQVSGYGFFGSMYRLDIEHGERLEVRCSDQNVSDWATTMRVGSVALVLALHQTPLGKDLEKAVPFRNREDSMKYHAKEINDALLISDDEFFLSKPQIQAIDYMKQVAELTMDKLQLYADLPIEYHTIAREIYDFCEDYRQVGRGDLPVSALADRADWAAKLSLIQRTISKDSEYGINRELGDYASRAQDMQYDMVRFTRNAGDSKTQIVYGAGMRLRQKGAFRYTVSDDAASKAFHAAPKETRANARAYLLQNYFASYCDWHRVSIGEEDYNMIELLEVNNPDLGPYNEDILSGKEKREH
jgi:hypothetical protein